MVSGVLNFIVACQRDPFLIVARLWVTHLAWSADLIAATAMDMAFGLCIFQRQIRVFFVRRPFASQRSSSSSSGLHHYGDLSCPLLTLNDFTHLLLRLILRSDARMHKSHKQMRSKPQQITRNAGLI